MTQVMQMMHTTVERLIQEKEELHSLLETSSQTHQTSKLGFKREMEQAIIAIHHLPSFPIEVPSFLSNGIPIFFGKNKTQLRGEYKIMVKGCFHRLRCIGIHVGPRGAENSIGGFWVTSSKSIILYVQVLLPCNDTNSRASLHILYQPKKKRINTCNVPLQRKRY